MKRALVWLLALLLVLACSSAVAEICILDDLFASVDVPGQYTVITPATLKGFETWLSARETTLEDAERDFETRGVLLQAWNDDDQTCFELRALQNEQTLLMFDINEQPESVRRQYRTSHYPDNDYPGFDFSTSEWKNTDNGRFLVLRYIHRDGGEIVHRGCMRRTIRNGYQIDFDMQVYGRAITNKDNNALNDIWNSFHFIEIKDLPPAAAAKINLTKTPPEETNEQSFSIEGTAAPGVKVTAVTMGLSYPDPVVGEAITAKNGKFSLPVRLPREGVFLVTITAEYEGEEVVELAYPVTYQRTLLAVNFTNTPPEVLSQDSFKITGISEPGATIQVFMDNTPMFTKRVTTAGRFAIELSASEEGPHEAMLVFGKKGLADRRFVFQFNRKWNQTDTMKYLNKQSIAPTYAQLTNNIAKYEGRIIGYRAYLLDVSQSGDEYIVTMALTKKNNKYSNKILVTTDAEPAFEIGERVMMYGTCEGMSISTGAAEDEKKEESYPCFALLLFSSLK